MPKAAKATPRSGVGSAAKETQAELAKRSAAVDEYGQLKTELAPFEGKVKRLAELGGILRSWAADAPADDALKLAGKEFEVILSAKENKTIIEPNDVLYRRLGKEYFLLVANVTLSALQRSLTPSLIAEITHSERLGPRSITLLPRETA